VRAYQLTGLAIVIAAGLAMTGNAGAQSARNAPPLTLPAYKLPQPNAVVKATYQFAADHPEVLRYVPCYCGCEMRGHKSNADCFVKSRTKNGDVVAWEEHGMVCSMCLAVGIEAARQYQAGKPVAAIRAAVEEKYGGITEFRTPTPKPPVH
jgi:hypothetical protein